VLARQGCDPRPLAGLDLEIAPGDVRNPQQVRRACEGVDAVVHSAGYVQIGWTGADLARDINVGGSRHVAEAARLAGARMVHVSSVDALGVGSPKQPADEETPPGGKIECPYVVTKREAERVVLDAVKQGLDAVIVNPGFMIGPWDWKPSSGRMLLAVAERYTPVAPKGGMTLCDPRDVAAGVIASLDHGVTGRRYVLGGHCMTYFDAWRLFAEVSGAKGPWLRAGPVMRVAAGAATDLWTWVTGKEPEVNSAAIRMSNLFHFYSSARAESELGYRCRPPRESVAAAWQWFQQHGYA
jgi:dihydroflavonol-4-reductase